MVVFIEVSGQLRRQFLKVSSEGEAILRAIGIKCV